MEEEIIFNEENIIEQDLDKRQKEEEIESQKEQNSSQETSQYEKSPKKEQIHSETSIPQITFNEYKKEKEIAQISTYILNYTRNKEELKELFTDTKLKKSENCVYKLDIKLIPNGSVITNKSKKNEKTPSELDYFLVIYCHEIAALSFDEVYEKIYSLKDLCKESRFFRIFESTDEAKVAIDEFITINQKNPNKFFVEFENKVLKIHMKFSFFDKEKEIVFNVPQKILGIKGKNELLPGFLKEIQEKLYRLADENNKLKIKNLTHSFIIKKFKYNLGESNEKLNKTE
jgi:hypothetical protein